MRPVKGNSRRAAFISIWEATNLATDWVIRRAARPDILPALSAGCATRDTTAASTHAAIQALCDER